MTSDQEPRYRLVDANGNIVGSLYGKPDGSVAIQETASGADREVTLAPDGTFSAPSVETESVTTEQLSVDNIGARLSVSSEQTIPTGSGTTVELDSSGDDDMDGLNISNNSYTIQESGGYLVNSQIRYQTGAWSTGDEVRIVIRIDGTARINNIFRKVGDGFQTFQSSVAYRRFSEGSEITLETEQDSGSDQTIDSSTTNTFLSIIKVA